jgi:O-antigen ligase
MKLLKTLIVTIFILFPFGELLRFDIGNNVVIKPLDLVVGLIIACWIFLKSRKVQSYSSKLKVTAGKNIFFAVIAFSLIGLLSLSFNLNWLKPQEFFVSSFYLLRWVAYAGMFFVISQFDKKFKKLIIIFSFIDGLLILFFGYLQYFFYNSLKNLYYLGWDDHMHRMFSTFLDPNFTGGFLVLYFLLTAGIIQRRLQNKKGKHIVLLSLVLILTLIGIFLTFSRSALLMLIFGVITFLILINKKKLIFLLLAIILLFGIVVSPKFYDENMNLFRQASGNARLGNYTVALRIIQDRPLLGVGFNSYRYTKNLYGLDHDWTNVPSHADAGVDNSFLFVLATTGIVGLSAYIYLWYLILRKSFNVYKKNIFAVVVISSSVGLFINALFINSLFFAPFMLWMWIIIGLMQDD